MSKPGSGWISGWTPLALLTGLLIVISVIFGGASRENVLRLSLVELTALPVLVLAGARLIGSGDWRTHRFALGIMGAALAIPLLQIIPLPPAVWQGLPGRDALVLALDLANVEPGWAPLSLTPDQTWSGFLALLPPAAAFLAILTAVHEMRGKLVPLYLVLAAASIALGVMQMTSGASALYPYRTTDPGIVVGFFANRNHLAILLIGLLPFIGALLGHEFRKSGSMSAASWFLSALAVLIVVSLGVIQSRAGIILSLPAVLVGLGIGVKAQGRMHLKRGIVAAAAVSLLVVAAATAYGMPRLLARFDDDGSLIAGRSEAWKITWDVSAQYLPVGTGVGSFDPVYRSVEPLEGLDPTFLNQAHNEYLQVWLEMGWPGAALVLAFVVWWCRRTWETWRGAPSREQVVRLAASAAILFILIHSAVDYPLRTATISVFFATCAALLELAGRSGGGGGEYRESRRRKVRTRVPA